MNLKSYNISRLRPPGDKLEEILILLKMIPRDLIRKKEKTCKESGLNESGLSHAELIDAMVQYPILIERPIVLANEQVALDRPPENIFTIL